METRLFRDYYSKILMDQYPDLTEATIRSILEYGARNMLKILSEGNDIVMMAEDGFWAFAGRITYDQEERDKRANLLKRRKIKARRLATCDRFSKVFYMPIKKNQYIDVFINKNFNGLKMYKLLDEAKGTSALFILKVELEKIERKHVITFFDNETSCIECILRWSKYGYKRTDDTGKYID